MALNVSKNQPTTFSEARNEGESVNSVTTHLYLRSSSSSADHHASKSLDKDVVLRRIRHHKSLYKLRSTFHALISTSDEASPEHAGDTVSGYRQMWLQQGDAFSAP
ncbi:uncharacterized protein LOC132267576 [Cornus florida]|uniref:uncharacterized protein LOC132267576 n=1 Tax=Cornus florida TaxID=4283 RepID=UPI00289FF6D3|nr:uncharacterized protein LOC132267576 [Cornus florida]